MVLLPQLFDYRAAREFPRAQNNAVPAFAILPDLAGSFTETEHGEVTFSDITTPVLERVCQYFYYKMLNQNPYDPLTHLAWLENT